MVDMNRVVRQTQDRSFAANSKVEGGETLFVNGVIVKNSSPARRRALF